MSLSNKKKGTDFENEFCEILAKNGWWARKDKGYAQTCDIFAAKSNRAVIFECKTCKGDFFDIGRVEKNQEYSRNCFKKNGNDWAYFVYKLDNGEIYLSSKAITKPSEGIPLKKFLDMWRNLF
jgi:Holliday junction resolvase